ncbi:hypothetical protein BN1708_020400, partial [Verticillium longisporum]
HGHRDRACHDA